MYKYMTVLLILLFLATGVEAGVREPAVAGAFYPADSSELSNLVKQHLGQVEESDSIDGKIIALIVPHAGLEYSGKIAAHSYNLLEGVDIDNVILCGPSHRYRYDGLSVFGPFVNWKTPLGSVKCNNVLCDRLIRFNGKIEVFKQAHAQEHNLEVQLPYLQTVLSDFQITPVAMGEQSSENINLLAEALVSLNPDQKTVMVASTDWQHFRSASEGWKMDSLGLDCLSNLDADKLESLIIAKQVELCGGGPTVAVMKAAVKLGADKVKILKYGDSGDE